MTNTWIYLPVLLVIGVIDWQQRRIPNNWVAVLFLAALVFAWLQNTSYQSWGLSLLVALLLTLPAYFAGKVGGGDVKLMIAASPIWPAQELLAVFCFGVMLTALALWLQAQRKSNTSLALGLPLGTAMALGCSLLLLLQYGLPESNYLQLFGLNR